MIDFKIGLNYVLKIFILFILSLLSIPFVHSSCLIQNQPLLFKPHLECAYHQGKFISLDSNYMEVGTFVPLAYDEKSYFIDLKGRRFEEGTCAASVGAGFRRIISSDRMFGVNTYYDYRRSPDKHNFNQLGLGLEWLDRVCDIKINAYLALPHSSKRSEITIFDQIGGGFWANVYGVEYAYSGCELLIERSWLLHEHFSLYGILGPYYYYHLDQDDFWGGQGGIGINWKSILAFQIRITCDKVYSACLQGAIHLTIPLYDFCETGRTSKLIQPVRRNGIILLGQCDDWIWNW